MIQHWLWPKKKHPHIVYILKPKPTIQRKKSYHITLHFSSCLYANIESFQQIIINTTESQKCYFNCNLNLFVHLLLCNLFPTIKIINTSQQYRKKACNKVRKEESKTRKTHLKVEIRSMVWYQHAWQGDDGMLPTYMVIGYLCQMWW